MIDPANPDYTNSPVSAQRPCFGHLLDALSAPAHVTIITAFYNTGLIFHETARSVLQQSFQQWEWLIINDGSTDPQSLSILEAYRHHDPRIRVIDHATNQGLSAARNTGFRAAQTQYVVQLDSDDLLEPTAVEKWWWFLESHPEFAFAKGFTVQFGAEELLWERGFHDGSAFLQANLVNPTSVIRKAVHQSAGGYDETDRGGLMDWDFWLRCASHGYWGGTVSEYLDWYRRRQTHADLWADFDDGERQQAYGARLRQKYSRLWEGEFPQVKLRWHMPHDTVPDELPCENRLRKDKRRLLLVAPWMTFGGADKFNLDLLRQLTERGWEITIATTLKSDDWWLPLFARCTPDIFSLHHFLRLIDYPRFLRYLIHSRQVDVVLISHSELGYLLLPYLRAHFPDVTFVDFCHIEEEHWNNGGYPRWAVEYQELLDLNVVSSEHLKGWMVKRGADPQRIKVCYTNIDTEEWHPDPEHRAAVRRELGLDDVVPLILYAGRICPQKQPRVFAQTVLRLHQQGSHFAALVAGDGEEIEGLRSFINKHKLNDRVRLLGAVSNLRVKHLMAAADVLFLPSRWEGIALTIYEAMACGLPVVAADVGGHRELVAPECGVLITRSDERKEAQQYAEVLAGLLRDPQRRKEMARASRARISTHFRLEQMGEQMLTLIEQAMICHTTHPPSHPSLGLGRACAAQAVEHVRLSQLSIQLWTERYKTDRSSADWRMQSYLFLNRFYEPCYRWGVNRGWTWFLPLGEKARKLLLRRERGL
ncbi:MAG: glycosyltransferase [Acidobacteria bacterium]|nr:glycosyltransferase [Acidobacteriota bacterium]